MNKNTITIIIFIAVLAVLGYFLFNKKETPTPIVSVMPATHYSCEKRTIDATFSDTSVSLLLSDGRTVVLPQVISGSGFRYEKNAMVFYGKGDNAYLTESELTTYNNCVVNKSVGGEVSPGIVSFIDQGKTFSFNYPKDLVLSSGDMGYSQSWRANTQTLGITFSKVSIPKETQPKTNFSQAWFTVSTSSDPIAVKECLLATNGEIAKGKETINGVPYTVTELGDAGAGNFYNTKSYRTVRDNQCYAVEYTVHSTNIGAYSPDQGISQFDLKKATDVLEAMVHSVKFL